MASSTTWISEEEIKMRAKLLKRVEWEERYLFWGYPKDVLEKRRIRKLRKGPRTCYAYITVGNTRKTALVTQDQLLAYKLSGYEATLVPWPRFIFVKWLSSMDL